MQTHRIVVVIHATTYIVQSIDQRIHTGVGGGKYEKCLSHQGIHLRDRGLVQRVPYDDGIIRGPADNKYNHNRDGHLKSPFLCPA